MAASMHLPMAGFTSALAAYSSSDTFDSINNPPPTDAKDRAVQEEEEELDALQQLSDFLTHPGYDDDSYGGDEQWRYRVLIRDLMDQGPVFVDDQESSLDETASTCSDETSDTSIRVFLGAQARTVPAGWRATSTPKRASAFSNMAAINSPSIDLASPQCSPLSLVAETSQDSPPSKTYLVEIKENDTKKAVLDAFIRASSPVSEPSPTPKITDSIVTGLSRSPDISGSMDSSFPSHPKQVASFLALPSAPSPHQPTRREEKPHLLPMCPRPVPTLSNVKVLKLTNLPWSVNSEDLIQWLGNDVKKALIPVESQVIGVHILCDRSNCRTKCPAYIEITSHDVARDVIKRLNKQVYEGRNIRITIAPRRELQAAIFPTWAQNGLSTINKVPIITSAELEGLVELCKLKTPFAKSTPERPYMNLLSIAAKYPWQSVDLLNSDNEEQAKVLQAVRDGHKLLNQHGKRLKNYGTLKYLFTNFLEKHGGVSGNLRSIPVSSHLVLALPSPGPNLPVPRRHRISQTLLDLISPNKQSNANSEVAPKDRSTLIAGNTPDFVPAVVVKERFEALQAAPIKKESIYKVPSHLSPTPTTQTFPSTPSKVDQIIPMSESSANSGSDLYLQDQSNPSFHTSKTEDKPTYAKVASNFDLSPEVIEKIAKVEKLFTPIRMQLSKEVTPAQGKVCTTCDESVPQKVPVHKDASSYSTAKGPQEEPTESTLFLKQMADELDVNVETIKAIVKRLGAML